MIKNEKFFESILPEDSSLNSLAENEWTQMELEVGSSSHVSNWLQVSQLRINLKQ